MTKFYNVFMTTDKGICVSDQDTDNILLDHVESRSPDVVKGMLNHPSVTGEKLDVYLLAYQYLTTEVLGTAWYSESPICTHTTEYDVCIHRTEVGSLMCSRHGEGK